MKLAEYITNSGGTCKAGCSVIAAIALKANCKPSTLYMIALGHKSPSWRLAASIESATTGAVTRADLRPDVFGSASDEAA